MLAKAGLGRIDELLLDRRRPDGARSATSEPSTPDPNRRSRG